MSGLIKISGEWKPGPFIYRDEAVFGLNHVGQPICEGRSNLDISVDFIVTMMMIVMMMMITMMMMMIQETRTDWEVEVLEAEPLHTRDLPTVAPHEHQW